MGAPKTQKRQQRSADEAPPSANASEPNALERMRTLIGERPDRNDRAALEAYAGAACAAVLQVPAGEPVEHDEDLVDGDPPPGERTVTPRHGVVRTEPPIRPDRPAEQPAKTPRKPPARRKPRIEADEPAAGHRADLPLEAIEIRLEALDESPDNPRQTYDETALAELAASIAELGVLQPLLVRPAGERWQVVCGHRRLRAARLAGVEAVPCVVRPLRDDEASACRIVENLQRVDLPPLDEAERKAALDEVGNRLAAWAEERTWAELAPLVAVTLLREPGVISSSSEAQVALINGALRAAQGWHGFDPRWLEAAGLEAPASDEDDEDDAELEDDAP